MFDCSTLALGPGGLGSLHAWYYLERRRVKMIDKNQLAVGSMSETIHRKAVHHLGTSHAFLPFVMPHFSGLSRPCARFASVGVETAFRRKGDLLCRSVICWSRYATAQSTAFARVLHEPSVDIHLGYFIPRSKVKQLWVCWPDVTTKHKLARRCAINWHLDSYTFPTKCACPVAVLEAASWKALHTLHPVTTKISCVPLRERVHKAHLRHFVQ